MRSLISFDYLNYELKGVEVREVAASPSSLLVKNSNPSCDDLASCRTEWNIVVSCLATILLCTWITIHPNVLYSASDFDLDSEDRKSMNFRQKSLSAVRRLWSSFRKRIPVFIVALIYPEYILGWAVRQCLIARKIADQLGGTVTHGHFIIMGGCHYFTNDEPSLPTQPLHKSTVIRLVGQGLIELPSKAEIQDRSKSHMIIKILAFFQTSWFLIQCVARAASARSLPSTSTLPSTLTHLEIVTVAYISINACTYIAWWDKPQNVIRPIRYRQLPLLSSETYRRYQPRTHFYYHFIVVELLKVISCLADDVFTPFNSQYIPMFYSGGSVGNAELTSICIALLMGMVSAGIHCIAWSSQSFGASSLSQALLWRVFSLKIGILLVIIVFIMFTVFMDGFPGKWWETGCLILIVIGIALYVISRIGLLILALVALRSLPPAAYETTYWTSFIPHI